MKYISLTIKAPFRVYPEPDESRYKVMYPKGSQDDGIFFYITDRYAMQTYDGNLEISLPDDAPITLLNSNDTKVEDYQWGILAWRIKTSYGGKNI
ncbi:MAG: hypothetical protein GX478_10110 [Erysipelotrichaceae bacterium]|jgi:hypothetical protein|nr:hypothetical protein [Erysipelotrichaceae bacterium]